VPSPEPDPKNQKNFTDPESRIMKGGFVQASNGQIAVAAQGQIIVARDATQCAVDKGQLIPMVDAMLVAIASVMSIMRNISLPQNRQWSPKPIARTLVRVPQILS
jgi:hypothetical protein